MSQYFFKELNLLNAQARYADRLQLIDPILFPDNSKSLLDKAITADEVEQAIEDLLRRTLHKPTVLLNLQEFAESYSNGTVKLDLSMSARDMIMAIAAKQDVFRNSINSPRASMPKSGVLGVLISGLVSVLASSVPATLTMFGAAKLLASRVYAADMESAESIAKAGGSQSSATDSIGFIVILIAALLAGIAFKSISRKTANSPSLNIVAKSKETLPPCSAEDANSILLVIVVLSEIYLDSRA